MKDQIIQGDCLEVMKKMADKSVDTVVTDPPYGLSFMGKKWDYDVPSKEVWEECLRVLKPGGYLLSFAGTRTQHRMAVNIEDAGFEIRDMIAWVYGSGFPKSRNITLDMDKMEGHPNRGHRIAVANRHHPDGTLEPNGEILPAYEPKSDNAKKWNGWGTALKPALEPITVARKPIEGTVAENCLKWGVGGINIDGCRVGTQEELGRNNHVNPYGSNRTWSVSKTPPQNNVGQVSGRFPANLIHDGSDEVVGCFPESSKGWGKATNSETSGDKSMFGIGGVNANRYDMGGESSARFFKSIKQDLHCSLCYDTIEINQLTKNICNNTNANNAEKSLKTTQAITENSVQKSATEKASKNLVQNVKSAGNLCDLCGTYIAQRLAEPKKAQDQELTLGKVFISEPKKQILDKCLASFVELKGNTDTTLTMENLNLLFGYVLNAIDNYTQNCGEENAKENNPTQKSLLYCAKASKSERNRGCEDMEEKQTTGGGGGIGNYLDDVNSASGKFGSEKAPSKNNHPTVKPIALMEYLVKLVSKEGALILDPFAGSGSTLVACKNLGRNYIGIEREADYIKICEARLLTTQPTLLP